MNEILRPVKDAAHQLGISIWTLRKKVYEGDVESVKISAKLLIPESEIDRLIPRGDTPQDFRTVTRLDISPYYTLRVDPAGVQATIRDLDRHSVKTSGLMNWDRLLLRRQPAAGVSEVPS